MAYFGLRRRIRHRFSAKWPTKLWGVAYTVNGTLQCRPSSGEQHSKRAELRAAARMMLEETASRITREYMPTQLKEAESALTLQLSDWRQLGGHWPIEVRARLNLRLDGEDAARTQVYEDALRNQQLEHELYEARVAYLRDNVLSEADTARAWWIERHCGGNQPIAWDEFNTHVLPFVGRSEDAQTNAMRTAYVLAQVVERLGNDPARHKLFFSTARLLMEEMDWPDLAEGLTLVEQRVIPEP
ncbi:hypothetical protein SGLAM104S_00465 [Streptomyces glaucescens]